MNDIIIHISDLHIAIQKNTFGNRINPNTYLTVDPNGYNKTYIDDVITKIKQFNSSNKNINLIITGDISDIAENVEFNEAYELIKYLVDNLKISSDRLLIIPGDHDCHRRSIVNYIDESENSNILKSEINNIKFRNFNGFYKKIKGKDFNTEQIIFDSIEINDLIFLALNSNYKVDQNGGHGFFQVDVLDIELENVVENNQGKEIILCFHHNIEGSHEDTTFGQWEPENKKQITALFRKHGIKLILNGNEHTKNSKYVTGYHDIIVSDSGAFSTKEQSASFKIYDIIDNSTELSLYNNFFKIIKDTTTSEPTHGLWNRLRFEDNEKNEIEKFILKTKSSSETPIPENGLPEGDEDTEDILQVNVSKVTKTYKNKDFQEKIYSIIKEKSLFQQGHFHWSESSRAHNWINVSRMLEDNKDLQMINDTIIDLIEQHSLEKDTHLMIGLGYEGNMIASKASMKYNFPYTYFPYSYRSNDHNQFENSLDFNNSDGNYKNVIIVTDVVNGANTIKKFIQEREKEFFNNVEKITLISLFYTGDKELNYDILNGNTFKNIEFYSVKHIKVEKCPYEDHDYKDQCIILKDKLNCVHKFYNDKLVSK